MNPPKKSEFDTARQLVLERGSKVALRMALGARQKAKHARSRKQFQYWATVVSKIESLTESNETLEGASTASAR